MHRYIYTYKNVYMHIYMDMYTYIYMCIYTCMYIHIHICWYSYIYIYICICIYTFLSRSLSLYTYIYIHSVFAEGGLERIGLICGKRPKKIKISDRSSVWVYVCVCVCVSLQRCRGATFFEKWVLQLFIENVQKEGLFENVYLNKLASISPVVLPVCMCVCVWEREKDTGRVQAYVCVCVRER